MTFERVTFRPEGAERSQSVILRVTAEREQVLAGIEVDRSGDEVTPRGADERLRVIDKTLISKRTPLTMNRTYALLEVAS